MKKDYRNRRDSGPAIRGAKVTVRNGDVNGALRTLKKILDRDNRQKDTVEGVSSPRKRSQHATSES